MSTEESSWLSTMVAIPLSIRGYFSNCCWKKLRSKNFLITLVLSAVLFFFATLFLTTDPSPRRIVRLVPRIPFCNCTFFTESPTDSNQSTATDNNSTSSSEDTGSANSDSVASPSCLDFSPDFLSRTFLTRHTPSIQPNCPLLFKSDSPELFRVRGQTLKWKNSVEDEEFLAPYLKKASANKLLLNNFYVSQKEKDFPIAYVMLFHHKPGIVQQYFRLLRLLYRPQNVFCIHIDAKSPEQWVNQIKRFANHFPNIIIAKDPVVVQYSTVSILDAHLHCLEELHNSRLNWKYAINLHATELPLATNREIVESLEQAKGKNLIATGVKISDLPDDSIDKRRVMFKCIWNGRTCKISKTPKRPPPFVFDLYKGADSANGALTREFVKFVLTETRAKALKRFLNDVRSAVELFFNTLNQIPGVPGGTPDPTQNYTLPRVVVRYWKVAHPQDFCTAQKYIHGVCIAEVGDLPGLRKISEDRKWLFYNKYVLDYDHVVMDCMEEMLLQRNRQEHQHDCH